MSNPLSYLLQHRIKDKKGDTTQLAAQLAPLEEQGKRQVQLQAERDHIGEAGATQEVGAIVVGSEGVRLSKEIMEGKSGGGFLGMEPVVLVILLFMLGFIAFIAWQISLMPRPE
jgi:phosphopantetheine adenylyltransferase